MKSPNFENCQIELNEDGTIGKVSEAFVSWVGHGREELSELNFRNFFLSLERSWELLIPPDFHKGDFECFLPLSSDSRQSSLGIFNFVQYDKKRSSFPLPCPRAARFSKANLHGRLDE